MNEDFVKKGFAELRKEGNTLVTSALGNNAPHEEHIG